MKKIGAFWRSSKNPKVVATGEIELINGIKQKVGLFINDKKDNDKLPDFNLVLFDDDLENEDIEIIKPIKAANTL